MRQLCIVLFLSGVSLFAVKAQEIPLEPAHHARVPKRSGGQAVGNTPHVYQKKAKKDRRTFIETALPDHSDGQAGEQAIHRYICQRCGTENQMDWSFQAMGRHLELIPHCGYCGKKYWPKFKPSGLLERTYCREVFSKPSLM